MSRQIPEFFDPEIHLCTFRPNFATMVKLLYIGNTEAVLWNDSAEQERKSSTAVFLIATPSVGIVSARFAFRACRERLSTALDARRVRAGHEPIFPRLSAPG